MKYFEYLDRFIHNFDYIKFKYQIFIVFVLIVVFPVLLSMIRNYKRFVMQKQIDESTPQKFGLKLFHLVSSIVEETLDGKTGELEKFDYKNKSDLQIFAELHIDYLFMVFLSLKGLVGNHDLEKNIFEFVKYYYYPRLFCHWDVKDEALLEEKSRLASRFAEYNSYIRGDTSNWLLPLATKMVDNFSDDAQKKTDEINEVITEIGNVLSEVPILFYKHKYKKT